MCSVLHITHIFCTFGANLYGQSVLINIISALELSWKFIKGVLLVGNSLSRPYNNLLKKRRKDRQSLDKSFCFHLEKFPHKLPLRISIPSSLFWPQFKLAALHCSLSLLHGVHPTRSLGHFDKSCAQFPMASQRPTVVCKMETQLEYMYVYTMYTRVCMFGVFLYAQSVLINKISALELSQKFIRSALLVGYLGTIQYRTSSLQ